MKTANKDRKINTARKYEFVHGDERVYDGHVVRRIRALADIVGTCVKAGDKGGYVESESNLSHRGSCWVYDDAVVRNHAHVVGDAKALGRAVVCGGAMVRDLAVVCDDAMVKGRATIRDNATVMERAYVAGCADVGGRATVASRAIVDDNAVITDDAAVYDGRVVSSAHVSGKAVVFATGSVDGRARVGGYVGIAGRVADDATVNGHVYVPHEVVISGNADVNDERGFVAFHRSWTNDCVVHTRSNGSWHAFGRDFASTDELVSYAHMESERHGREIDVFVEAAKKLECVDDMFPCGSEDDKAE